MAPFQSARVIHERWSDHHRPTASGYQTAQCIIRARASSSGWDPVNGATPPTAGAALYRGPCGVQFQNAGTIRSDAVGQATYEHPYAVSIPPQIKVAVGARIEITASPDDPLLLGKVLTVEDIEYGSQVWDRVLQCDLDLTNQPDG